MEEKSKYYSKITDEDIGIAEQFFENEKHLDEFLANVSRYYSQRNLTIKTKIVQKYFTAYKKTMDFVLNARGTGSKGGLKAAENQTNKDETLIGVLSNPSETLIDTVLPNINSKDISNKSKDKTINNNIGPLAKFNFKNEMLIYGFDENLVNDWLLVRKTKKATNSETAFKNFIFEIEKKSCNINEMLKIAVANSWSGFKHEWISNQQNTNQTKKGNSTADLIANAGKIRPMF